MIPSTLLLVAALAAPSQTAPGGDNRASVAWLLEQRCAECHSPGSDDRRALKRWNAARDLASTAGNARLIVPGEPQESELFLVIEDGDMPPPDSDSAALSAEELALVGAWIRAGAPTSPRTGGAVEPPAVPARPDGWMRTRLVEWLGRFHPLVVHFPIALLLAALAAELLGRVSARAELRETSSFCLTLGALLAPPAAALGWFLAENTRHAADELFWHRWMGVATVALALGTLWVGRRRPRLRLPLLVLLAILVAATGHSGSELSFGDDWLSWPR